LSIKLGLVFPIPDKGHPCWPYDSFDFESRSEELTRMLKNSLPGIDFISASLKNQNEAKKFLEGAQDFKGFLVYFIGGITPSNAQITPTIAKAGKPVILIEDLYSGEMFFAWYPKLKEEGFPVIGVSSSNFEDVIKAVKLFKVIERMRESKILIIMHEDVDLCYNFRPYEKIVSQMKQLFGTEIVKMGDEQFVKEYLLKVTNEEAEPIAEKWRNKALKVVEPTNEDLIKSAKLYIAMKRLMKDVGANLITTWVFWYYHDKVLEENPKLYSLMAKMYNATSLDGPYKYSQGAFPCLPFFELNNEGIMAVCEADLEAAVTSLMVYYLAEEMTGEGIPGFTNEPSVDLSKGWMIYAHCMYSNRVFGPSGPESPFIIRSHGESRYSAAPSIILPIQEKVTIARIDLLKNVMLIHGGMAEANIETLDVERACRNKLAVKTNAEKILHNFNKKTTYRGQTLWHRTLFYGDWREHLKNLAALLGIEVFEEDKD